MTEDHTGKNKSKWAIHIIGLGSAIGIILIWWWNFNRLLGLQDSTSNSAATLGDSFGALNTLFSGLAFAGVIYTILLQSTELGLQRKELKETKDELKRSADAQVQQIQNQETSIKLQALSTLLDAHLKTEGVFKDDPHNETQKDLISQISFTLQDLYSDTSKLRAFYAYLTYQDQPPEFELSRAGFRNQYGITEQQYNSYQLKINTDSSIRKEYEKYCEALKEYYGGKSTLLEPPSKIFEFNKIYQLREKK